MKKAASVSILVVTFVLATMLILPSGAVAAGEEITWAQMYNFVRGGDQGIWGSAGDDVYAVGEWGAIYRYYDGAEWSEVYNPMSGRLYDIHGNSSNNIFAVGYRGFEDIVVHYDGNEWGDVYSNELAETFEGIWCSSGSEVFVVGGGPDSVILHYDGHDWGLQELFSGQWCGLHGVWGSSEDDVFAVGRHQMILHYNGSNWTQMGSTVMHRHLYGVWGNSSTDVFAVGWGGKILHYNGSNWSAMASGTTSDLRSVWGNSGTDVFAVGDNGTILHYDGSNWSQMNSGTSRGIEDIWGSSGNNVFTVGWGGQVLHYGGQRYNVTGDWEVTSIDGGGTFDVNGNVTSGQVTVGVSVTGDIGGEFDFVCKLYPGEGEDGKWYGTSASISGTVTVDGIDHPATLWLKGYFNTFNLTGEYPPNGWEATLGCPQGETHGWTTDGSDMAADFGWEGSCEGNVSTQIPQMTWTTSSGSGIGTWDGVSNTCLAGKTEYQGAGSGQVSLPMSPEEVTLDYDMAEAGDFILGRYDSNPGSMPGTRHFLSRFVQVDSSVINPEIEWGAMGLSIEYTDEEVTASILNEDTLALYWWNSGSEQWEQVPGSWANPEENYVTGSLTHFSSYSIQGDSLNIYSCDDEGMPKDEFDAGESMYVAGSGLDPETDYRLWLQPPGMQENGTLTDVNDFSEYQELVTTDDAGNFEPVEIWDIFDGLNWGRYDFSIVADNLESGTEGYYNECDDELDSVVVNGLVVYVDQSAGGGNDGTSWYDAYVNLQDALMNIPGTPCQIWVATGTYTPAPPGQPGTRTDSFQMKNGVTIYGGFLSYAGSLEDRDWETNFTVLSGEIGSPGIEDNCYHIFYHPSGTNLNNTAILDGFTITSGNANGGTYTYYSGGGMYNWYSSPSVTNCTFSGNSANDGGGMYNYYSSPEVTNCIFSGNLAYWGGGMYNDDSSPEVTNCIFSGNLANYAGGGMHNEYSSPAVTNCTFSGNSANHDGGGMYNYSSSSPEVTNCTFSGNSANYDGGGMYNYSSSSPEVTNCTFSGNLADDDGGGMVNYSSSSPEVTNCILWGDSPDEVYNSSSTPVISYCDIEGGYSGTGNISADPQWVNPGSGDFHLQEASPCINAGTNSAPNLPAEDFEGDNRIIGDVVDMGVDEFCYYNLSLSSTNGGSVSTPGEGTYPYECGTVVAITAVPDPCYEFDIWTGDTSTIANPGSPNTTITMNGDYSIQANFTFSGTVIYVNASAIGSEYGCTWADAFTTLQQALDVATPGKEIWVATGTYTPAPPGQPGTRTDSFQMKNGVTIYGGFLSYAGSLEDRDWETNLTVLSGDIGTPNYTPDNCYHVFCHSGSLSLDNTAVLDGFIVTGANADGSYPHDSGGGMYNYYSSPAVTNCTFDGNSATYGGGMANYYSPPAVTNCTFRGNLADYYGGGMYNDYYSSPTVNNCTFWGNLADIGGGMYNFDSSPAVTNCTFWDNSADYDGGGMANYYSSMAATNCILWGDTGGEIYNYNCTPVITCCNIEGGYAGTGNISGTPMFVNPGSGDFHLQASSPCINTGTNSAPNLPAEDFEGDNRILGDVVDMGVDEYVPPLGTMVKVYVNLQGANRPSPEGWQVPLNIGFYPPGSPNSWLLNPGSAIYYFPGTATAEWINGGTKATVTVGPVNPGTYDITADSSTTLLNVKKGVHIE